MLKIEDYISRLEKAKGVCFGVAYEYKELGVCVQAKVKIDIVERVLEVLNRYNKGLGKAQFQLLVTAIENKKGSIMLWQKVLEVVEVAISLKSGKLVAGRTKIVANDKLINELYKVAENNIYELAEEDLGVDLLLDLPFREDGLTMEDLKRMRAEILRCMQEVKNADKVKNVKQKNFPLLYCALAPSFFNEGAVFWTRERGCFVGNVQLCACIFDIYAELGIVEKDEFLLTEEKFDRTKRFLQYKYPSNPKALIISREFFKVEV